MTSRENSRDGDAQPAFQPARLEQALEASGKTAIQLSHDIQVAPTTISRWRTGLQEPKGEVLFRLAHALNVTSHWLMRAPSEALSRPYFRGSIALMKADRAKLHVRLSWLAELAEQLEEFVDFPPVDVPRMNFAKASDITDVDIEEAAALCRARWGLKNGPVADVVLVLESAGVIIAREETGAPKIEGLSAWSSSGRPFVLLCADKANAFRSRFDAAHELAHLVLHGAIPAPGDAATHKLMEQQAHRFAGAFLMPGQSYWPEVPLPVSLNGLLILKKRWGVSAAAQIMRLVALDAIDDDTYLRLIKLRSARWGAKAEPMDDELIPEQPRLLRRTANMLLEAGLLTVDTMAERFGLSLGNLESLLGFSWGALTRPAADVVPLPVAQPVMRNEALAEMGRVFHLADRRPNFRWAGGGAAVAISTDRGGTNMSKKDIHVTPHPEGWAVRREGNERATSVSDTKADAMEKARDLGRRDHVEVVEHGRDGKIQGSNSYGNDPNPPKDRKP